MLRLLLLSLLLFPAATALAAERKVTLRVENMTCALCPVTVRAAIERVPGVADVQVDLDSGTAVVVFDDAHATIDDVTNASSRAGYPASLKE